MQIPLTKGKTALVDEEDYEELSQYKWSTSISHGKSYAVRMVDNKMVYMHRVIMKTPSNMLTDHIDSNGLNNQKKNLRICSNSENLKNRGANKNNKSGFKGVSFYARDNNWEARIMVDGRYLFLGRFETPEKAHTAYQTACNEYHGEFANHGETICK